MSSIFDALRKLEDQKGGPQDGGPGDDLFRPPAKWGSGNARRGALLAVAVLLAVGGGYFFWRRGDAKEPLESTVAPPARTAPVAQVPVPQNIMTEAQRQARLEMLKKYAALQARTVESEAGEGAAVAVIEPPAAASIPLDNRPAPITRVVPEAPAEVAPPAVPAKVAPPAVPAVVAPPAVPAEVAPPAVPAQVAPPAVPAEVAPPAVPAEVAPPAVPAKVAPPAVPARVSAAENPTPPPGAPAPEPKPLIETDFKMLTLTEVTHHVRPENRWARIKIGEGPARKVREGDDVEGIHVGEIQFGSVALQMAGTDVVVEVGESVSFTVSEPDFH